MICDKYHTYNIIDVDVYGRLLSLSDPADLPTALINDFGAAFPSLIQGFIALSLTSLEFPIWCTTLFQTLGSWASRVTSPRVRPRKHSPRRGGALSLRRATNAATNAATRVEGK